MKALEKGFERDCSMIEKQAVAGHHAICKHHQGDAGSYYPVGALLWEVRIG